VNVWLTFIHVKSRGTCWTRPGSRQRIGWWHRICRCLSVWPNRSSTLTRPSAGAEPRRKRDRQPPFLLPQPSTRHGNDRELDQSQGSPCGNVRLRFRFASMNARIMRAPRSRMAHPRADFQAAPQLRYRKPKVRTKDCGRVVASLDRKRLGQGASGWEKSRSEAILYCPC